MNFKKLAHNKFEEAQAKLQAGEVDLAKSLLVEARGLKAQADLADEIANEKSFYEQGDYTTSVPVGNGNNEPEIGKAILDLRSEKLDDGQAKILKEVYGEDYRQRQLDEMKSFNEFLAYGKMDKRYERQRWSKSVILDMVKHGLSIEEIKSTMVEGQDTLGGYAVPPELSESILQRSAGLVSVRQAGATVVKTASNSVNFIKLTGGTSRYSTALRGYWGNETKNPVSETNLTYGLDSIPVHVYTFKTPMSTSFLEDARNVAQLFEAKVAEILSLDEDEAFLTGNGMNKPRGILPGGANVLALQEVNSGSAATVTYAGLKLLPRGIATQYRQNSRASWIANSATSGVIETLVDSEGRFFVNSLVSGEQFMRSRWLESEAMPALGANTFPIIYGDFSGYTIVERLGLSVSRFQDSGTGSNLVEFHVRRRIGGDVLEGWKFAVQKCAA